ncbi:hypothetical protein, partial [Anaerotignum lactatifermentans]|uniref:hypothetical protein n=1 Tax=Anaerotignum lactatifermentans TaxID=160404 RepID=UPI003AB70036
NNVTDVGRLLLGDVQMGASFVPTKIVIGKGYLPQGKTTRTMTDVADVVKELALNKATKNPDGDAIFGAIFSNADIQEAFYYRELGLYAKGVYYNQSGGVERETAEVLYSYGNAGENAELIPAYSTGSVVERQLDLLVYIGNDTEVKLEIETGLYVTIPVFNETVERLEKDIEEVRYIVDSTTAKKYEWAMENGTLSLDEVDGDTKINIADKETLDAVKEKVDFIHTNTEGLSGKIGETNDSGGSEAAGSVFAKLNKIIGDIAAHVKQWTAERAEKLDQLDTINENAQTASTKATELVEDVAELKAAVAQETTVEGISNKIGAEGDEDTQPTLFGRLAQLKNVLVEKLAEVLTKVTGIDGKIGTSGDAAGSATLFGQIKTIVDTIAGKKYRYSDTVQHTESATYSTTNAESWGKAIVLYNFEAEYDGVIHVSAQFNIPSGNSGSFGALHCLCESSWQPRSAASGTMKSIEKCLNTPTGTTFSKYFSGKFSDNGEANVLYGGNFSKFVYYGTNDEIHSLIKCKKGDKVSIVADIYSASTTPGTVGNLKVMYDVK